MPVPVRRPSVSFPSNERLEDLIVSTNDNDEELNTTTSSNGRLRLNIGRRYLSHSREAHRSMYLNSNNSVEQLDRDEDREDQGFFGVIPSTAEIHPDDESFHVPSSFLRYALARRRPEQGASLPTAINQMATDTVAMDAITANTDDSIFNHGDDTCDSQNIGPSMLNGPIRKRLDDFMSRRRQAAVQYDTHRKWKNSNRKKRTFREVIGEKEIDPFENFKFDEIRVSSSSYMKAGLCYKCTSDEIKLSFIDVDLLRSQAHGFIEFKNGQELRRWKKSYMSRSKIVDNDFTNGLAFQANVVDFEKLDLRYKSHSYDTMIGTLGEEFRDVYAPSRKSVYSVMYSNFINKQLYKWRLLKPFKGISVEQHKSIATCVNCLAMLQSRFVIMHISTDGNDNTEFLMALDKHSGALELVSSEFNADTDVSSLRRSAMGITHSFDKVFKFTPASARYISPSICIR
jgi:hypothetical protein